MSDRRLSSLVPPRGWLDQQRPPELDGPGAGFLVALTLMALVLRLVNLGGMSLWVDEVFTWELVSPQVGGDFASRILAAYQGPLYHAAAWPLVRLVDNAFMLRFPAALAGTIAVPVLGVLGGHLWGRDAGRMAAVLTCISPFLSWYSQEARGYAFVMLFAAGSGLVLFRAMRDGINLGRSVGLMLLIGAGLMSNFSFIFLLVAYGLTVLLVARPRSGREWFHWTIALGGGVLLALPWLLEAAGIWEVGRVVPGAEMGSALRGPTTFSPWAIPFTGFALLYGFSLGPSLAALHGPDQLALLRSHAPLLGVAMLVAMVPLVTSLAQLARRRWVLLLWIAIPLVGVVLLAVRNVKPFNVRYVATVWPWLTLLLAAGLCRLALWPRRLVGAALAALCVVSLIGLQVMPRYAKADIRGAAARVVLANDDAGRVLAPTVGPVVRRYLPRAEVLGCWDEALLTDDAAADALVARQLAGADTAWYLRARAWELDPHGLLPSALARAGRVERIFEGANVSLDFWVRQPATAEGTP